MRFGEDGRLHAINPEAGFFGVAPGTGLTTNRNAILTLHGNCIFTNTALTEEDDVWWEGLTPTPPSGLTDWQGRRWWSGADTPAAHPNARFTAPAAQCPTIAPEWDSPEGVPISAILFGGRRASAVPLVTEAYDWQHGVYLAANIASEGTAAAENAIGALRRDPFAMLPFCGYHMADYFAHWLRMGAAARADASRLPRLYLVNWFRKNSQGKFAWPGFGDNIRVLKWIVERIEGDAQAVDTPIGRLPAVGALDLEGLDLSDADRDLLLSVDAKVWREEAALSAAFLGTMGDSLPPALIQEQCALERRLETAQ
jgi:phosphoenolpyruvate carboxykinase (GTP)